MSVPALPLPDDAEADRQIRRLLAPSGDPQYRLARGAALTWLLEHPQEAYPRLLAILQSPAPPALALAAVVHFQRADSVPVLEHVLHTADDPTVVVAAQALAEHPAPEAGAVLRRALGSAREQTVASAADGLAMRGDSAACVPLTAALQHPDPDVRRRVQAAVARLGCEQPAHGAPG
ncbi:HEAT repeat domain-containing protein [Catellatospora chokoriensis]|uniref:HEAT repeat-containing protein n=1 Tax=Catellatospora chokoriensis TaxID=310353 RepID=A0A8J3K452_9ACTN|nr:HEAT repeat domain-containing protein [Catellatospora chokoriensis]GIF90375.1 hypothetical protein Cch02nite_38190 [Catellatospora chokoriensis]